MSSVLLKAGCFFLIILMGYGLKKIGLLSQTDLPVFSKLVTKITLPAAIIHNFSHAGDRADWFPVQRCVCGDRIRTFCERDEGSEGVWPRKCVGIQYRLLYDAFRPGILRSAGRGLYQPF